VTDLARAWTHSHEEDDLGRLVFRPSEHTFPPARGRESFTLSPGGLLEQGRPGADDRAVTVAGRWSLDGDRLDLVPERGASRHYVVEEVGPDRLVLRRVGDAG
jgi:hypothetical protein